MELSLDRTADEIQAHLQGEDFVVFHGFISRPESQAVAFWDTQRRPDFREFLAAARALGVKLIVMRVSQFQGPMVDEARDRLEESEMPPAERRRVEKQLRDLHRYEGFTCCIDLAFDYQNRVYVFNLNAEWYSQFLSLSSMIDSYAPYDDEDDWEDSPGDHYTRN